MSDTIQIIQAKLSMLQTQIAMVTLTLTSMQSQMNKMEDIIVGKRLPMLKTNPDHFVVDSDPGSCDEEVFTPIRSKPLSAASSECDSDEVSMPRRNSRRSIRRPARAKYPSIMISNQSDNSSGYDS
jgi:hypothetical protein